MKRTHPYVTLPGELMHLPMPLHIVDPWDPTGVEQRIRAGEPTPGDLIVAASIFGALRILANAQPEERNAVLDALLALPHEVPAPVPAAEDDTLH